MANKKKSTDVAVGASKEVSTQMGFTREQVDLIKSTVAKGATDDELKLFMYTAKRTGLDPLTKQIHFVKRKVKNADGSYRDQMAIQTGIDGYRAIAERTRSLAGIDDAVYEVNAETQRPSKATVTVYRFVEGQKVPFTASARWSEYAPTGNQAFMWNKMPFLMLGKCAEALALRKAFPNDLTGIYTHEEMDQASTGVVEVNTASSKTTAQDTQTIEPPKKPAVSDKFKIVHLLKLLEVDPFLIEKGGAQLKEEIKKLTGVELVEENLPVIVERLEIIHKEREEAKKQK